MAELRVSELPTAVTLGDSDLLLLSQPDANSDTGYASAKTTNVALATKIAKNTNFGDLATTSKSVLGAINEVKQLAELIPTFSIAVVAQLPTQDISETTIYLVPSENPETENAYDEFIYVDNEWEQVGSTAVDLSAYYTKLEVNGLLDLKESKADMEDDVTDIVVGLTDTQTATGNPVTLTTVQEGGAKSAVVEFNPIQDLHGQSAPYPAGGGKNKFDCGSVRTYTNGNVVYTVRADGTVNVNGQAQSGNPNVMSFNFTLPAGSYILNGCPSNGSDGTYRIDISGTRIVDYGEGASFTFSEETTGSVRIRLGQGYNAQNLVFKPMIRLSSVADDSFVPYSNICPISGRDSLYLRRCDRVITNLVQGGVQDGNGQDSSSTKRLRTDYIEFDGNPFSVAIQNRQTNERFRSVHFYDSNQTYLGYASIPNTEAKLSTSIPANAKYFRLVLMLSTDTDLTLANEFISYNKGIEAYYDEHTATFPDTVYGGKLDFVSGKLAVTHICIDLGNLNWHYGVWGNSNSFDYTFSNIVSNGNSSLGHIMCSIYKNVTPNNLYTSAVDKTMTLNNTALRIVNNDYTDPATFKTAMSGVQFCYELATPQEITLTPQEIELLKGMNVLWTDGDNIIINYAKLPQGNIGALVDYIQQLEARVAALENS